MLVRVPAARGGSERIWRFGRSDKPDRFPTFGIQNPRRRDEHPHKTPCSASPEPILIRFDYLRRLLSVGRLTTRTDRGWPSDHSTGLFTYAGDTGPPGEVVFLGSHPRLASLPFAASTDAAELAGCTTSKSETVLPDRCKSAKHHFGICWFNSTTRRGGSGKILPHALHGCSQRAHLFLIQLAHYRWDEGVLGGPVDDDRRGRSFRGNTPLGHGSTSLRIGGLHLQKRPIGSTEVIDLSSWLLGR